jgi:integrase
MNTLTMNDLFDRYIKEYVPRTVPRTQRDYTAIVNNTLRPTFGHMLPQDVKPRHVVAFLDVSKGRIHRNRMVMILSRVFYLAIGKWCIDDELRNPCIKVEMWPVKPRTRYITDAEFNGCREICPPQVQIAMDLALLTGQRQSDIVGLTWKQVKTVGVPRADWRIEIDQGKTGKKLAIMISPAIETVLKRARVMEPNWPHEFVIRTNPKSQKKKGLRYSPDGFRALWQRCMRKWIAMGNENFHFHDIRAKCISDNSSLDNAYLLAGHIDLRMTRRTYDRNRRRVEPLR